MCSPQELYSELLALTQLYLLKEVAQTTVQSNSETVQFFKSKPKASLPEEKKEIVKVPPIPAIKIQPEIKVSEIQPAVKQEPPLAELKPKQLEPLKATQETDLKDIREAVIANFPNQKIIDTPPSDREAKLIANRWQKQENCQIILLAMHPSEKCRQLLLNIGKAIKLRLNRQLDIVETPEQLNKEHSHFKLLIATTEQTGADINADQRFNIDPELLLKEPQRKAELWKQLCHSIRSL